MDILRTKRKKRIINKGFTLVELVVVLALMAIVLSVSTVGVLGWIDWATFRSEEATAEDIFYAAQNQLTELDSSNSLYTRVQSKLLASENTVAAYEAKYLLAKGKETDSYNKYLSKMKDSSGNSYVWKNIWVDQNVELESRSIIRLTAANGDYTKYLENRDSVGAGTRLIFDLIAPYIADKTVLDGSIAIEFSPEAAQVFAVCYSDKVDVFTYEDGESAPANALNILNRNLQDRQDNMLGYYGVDTLNAKIRGRSEADPDYKIEIDNGNFLTLLVSKNKPEATINPNDTFTFAIQGAELCYGSYDDLMTFTVKVSDIQATDFTNAGKNPVFVNATMLSGVYNDSAGENYNSNGKPVTFRIPMWVDSEGYHVILDAVDIQAQSVTYANMHGLIDYSDDLTGTKKDKAIEDAKTAFANTFSFYRFGFKDVNYIRAELVHHKYVEGTSCLSKSSRKGELPIHYYEDEGDGERTTFANVPVTISSDIYNDDPSGYDYNIKNARHFYNMRFETDYKEAGDADKSFILKSDIDWEQFVNAEIVVSNDENNSEGENNSDGENNSETTIVVCYCLNSYKQNDNENVTAGIDFDGIVTANKTYDSIPEYPFPGFRCLSAGDSFTQQNEFGKEDSYVIKGLNISFVGNVIYGVYGLDTKEECYDATSKSYTCASVLGVDVPGTLEKNIKDYTGYNKARAGLLPLGLFAENLGDISNITLDNHKVIGLEPFGNTLVYTNMVGGFAGDNIGTISNLTLLDSKYDNKGNFISYYGGNKSKVNGHTDVGGIIGRESYVVKKTDYHLNPDTNKDDKDIVIANMKNYSQVSGLENVGGIVGRAYVHYFGDDNTAFDVYKKIMSYNPTQINIPVIGEGDNTKIDETNLRMYNLASDGCYTSETFKSMSGVDVSRARSVSIQNCSNRGRVSGDAYLYDTSLLLDGVAATNRHCAFIGGIAGTTQDGYYYTDRDLWFKYGKGTQKYLIDIYKDSGFFTGQFNFMEVKNCDSFMLYTKDEIEAISNNICVLSSNQKNKNYVTKNKDNYVGGLIGYSRLTHIEGCNNNKEAGSTTEYLASSDNALVPFVSGERYVGGLIGCAEECYFSKADGEEYSATNYNLVIGETYVGGVAGCVGIGDVSQHNFSYRNPSLNNASQPSQLGTVNYNDAIAGEYLLNNGIVLGIKNNWHLVLTEDKAGQYKLDEGTSKPANNECLGSGCIGGVVGAIRTNISKCDNIQSVATKKYMLELIGFSENQINNFNDLTASDVQTVLADSNYGGNSVGGIIGKQFTYGALNRVTNSGEKADSIINAIVFGQDYVGGGIGNQIGDDGINRNDTDCYNIFTGEKGIDSILDSQSKLEHMVVIGRDGVGGIMGYEAYRLNSNFSLDNDNNLIKKDIDQPYCVYGRIATGGVSGILNSNTNKYTNVKVTIPKTSSEKIEVNGIAYTGGVAGICESRAQESGLYYGAYIAGSVSGVNVYGKYFTGGFLGAAISNNRYSNFTNLVNKKFTMSDISVDSELFAGGMAGLYTAYTGEEKYFCYRKTKNNAFDNPSGYSYLLAINNLFDEDGKALDNKTVYKNIVSPEEADKGVNDIYKEIGTVNFLDQGNLYESNVTVKSDLYAGGLFGYSPDGMNVTISGFKNIGGIEAGKTTSSVGVNVSESFNGNVTYSYMGGIIGRIPVGMTINNCINEGSLVSNSSYLGGLAEVNAGIVKGVSRNDILINKTNYSYTSGGIGAFVGVNGTKLTDGVDSGVIKYCSNVAKLSCKNVGGIAATIGGPSKITGCYNHGDITVTGSAGGIVCDVMDGVTLSDGQEVALSNNVNTGLISYSGTTPDVDARAGIVYDSKNTGSITLCRNYGTGLANANGITGKTANSLLYNFDATNASNHIGTVVQGGTKQSNYYIGPETNSPSGYFVGRQYYSRDLVPFTSGDNMGYWTPLRGFTKIDNTETDINNLFTSSSSVSEFTLHPNGDNNSYLTFEIASVNPEGATELVSSDINNFSITWTKITPDYNAYFKPYNDRTTDAYSSALAKFMGTDSSSDYRSFIQAARDYMRSDEHSGEFLTINNLASDDTYVDRYAKSVFGYMLYEDGEYINNSASWTNYAIRDRYLSLLSSKIENNGSDSYDDGSSMLYKYVKNSSDYPEVESKVNEKIDVAYLDFAIDELDNGTHAGDFIATENFNFNNWMRSRTEYIRAYSDIYDTNYTKDSFADSISGSSYNEVYIYYSKYIFSTYCYMLNDKSDVIRDMTESEKQNYYIQLLYGNVERYGHHNYTNNNSVQLSYRMILTDVNGLRFGVEDTQTTVGSTDVKDVFSFRNGCLYKNDTLFANNANNHRSDSGFDSTKIANIVVIVGTDYNGGNVVGVRAMEWTNIGQGTNGSNAFTPEIGEDYFYSQQMPTNSAKYQLMLHEEGTGMNEISTDPYSSAFWDDNVSYSIDAEVPTVRYTMYTDIDPNYIKFIQNRYGYTNGD